MKDCFILEKDKLSRELIEGVISDFPFLRLVGTSGDRTSSINTILKESPDLVFLNIDDLKQKPLEFIMEINQCMEVPPLFIAISKSKDLAYDVIKLGFFDYLLKPLSELDVRSSIMKFQKKYSTTSNKTICLKSYRDYQYLNTDEILFLKADNNTTDFYMQDGAVICAFKTLRTFENILPQNFMRIHKSYVINSNYVSRIQYGKGLCTISKNNFHIPFTKTFIGNVEVINNTLYESSYLSLN